MSPVKGVSMDTPERSSRELDALFDQSPIAMVFGDRELRARHRRDNGTDKPRTCRRRSGHP
jgi:hypothetical protein